MHKIVFIVLHYIAINDTIECIESILKNIDYEDIKIIIVDNNSPNKSGIILKQTYSSNTKIRVLLSKENIGFAQGNNIGYKYAKEHFKPDFIICINNDTIICDKSFISKIKSIYDETHYGVLGPKIISVKSNSNQNPVRLNALNIKKTKKLIRHMKYQKIIIYFIQILGNNSPIFKFIKNIKKRITINKKSNNQVLNKNNTRLHNVQLHGACLIFSPLYIKCFQYAFYPETFMYFEEEILFYLCRKNNLETIYDPSFKIYHKEDVSTDIIMVSDIKKKKFIIKHSTKSAKVLLKLMRANNY